MNKTSCPKVVLVDVYDAGHHRSFVNLYARLLAESGQEVVALCPFPLEDIPSHLQDRVTHVLSPHDLSTGNSILTAIDLLRAIAYLVRQIKDIKVVFFIHKICGMEMLPGRLLDIFFPFPWAILEIHPMLERPDNRGGLLRRVKSKLLGRKSISERYLSSSHLQFVAFLTETSPEIYRVHYPHIVFACVPDVTHERTHSKLGRIAAEIKEASNGRKIVTIAGSLEQRKGLYELMYLALIADASRFYFAFCGPPVWETFDDDGRLFKAFRATSPENCYFHLKFISDIGDDNEFDSVIHCSDVIFCAMPGYLYSSNVITKAARMRRPVIVAGGGVCGPRVMRYRLGAVIPESDVFCALQALERFADTNHHDGAWDEYAKDFSVVKLREALVKLCEGPTSSDLPLLAPRSCRGRPSTGNMR